MGMFKIILIVGLITITAFFFLTVYACCVAASRADREAEIFWANYKAEQEKKLCEK